MDAGAPSVPEAADADARREDADASEGRRSPAPRRTRSPAERAIRVVLLFGGVAALFASKVPLCPVAIGLHQPCPGCGLTRASLAILRGDFTHAFHLHPLAFPLMPIIAVWLVAAVYRYMKEGIAMPAYRFMRVLSPTLLVMWGLLIALWVLRWRGYFGGPVAV
jgi:hypothetical protein